ncbi:unnamed protein product [Thlaspi arvense]|uniref:Poly(A) RNA polymerase mitochondrial-like central palm domain-containing protein n=1 Tax=Thlaspi arvense TaxID=13288 RepID=A0AAU9SKF3_THLAR|nr:unnamed protein product [Thlaspi arvense]
MDDYQNFVAEGNTLSSKAIRKRVKNSESTALQRCKIDDYDFADLDKVLNDVYRSFRPVSADYDTRKDMVKLLNAMALDIYGNFVDSSPVLEAYGSFVMDMFSSKSDLDVSINFGDGTYELPRDTKIQILRRFAEKLRSLQGQGRVRDVECILSARVPIVKFVDQRTSVECDLSVENKDGMLNSQIIHIISQIDERFQKLCMLVKHWAKAHEVNSALHRTLNSVSITLLVAHHLQSQSPPILPPFSSLFKDGIDPTNVKRRMETRFLNWGQRNKESLGRLFVTFFVKLQSVEFLWRKGLCVSSLNGLWISKKWEQRSGGSISVEDFTDVSQNVARRVNEKGAKKIYCSIHETVDDLLEFLQDVEITGTHLRDKLFRHQPVVLPPPPPLPPLDAYRQKPYKYEIGYVGLIQEVHHSKRVCLGNNGYRAVEGAGHMRVEEERYENLRNRYAGNRREEFHHEPLDDDDPYRQAPLNSPRNGGLVRHRHGGGEEEEPKRVGLIRDYCGMISIPPPPPPIGRVGRAYYECFGPQNFPEPYFGRPH